MADLKWNKGVAKGHKNSQGKYAKYEITPVDGGHHLTHEDEGFKKGGGWSTGGTFKSLGVHETQDKAMKAAHDHHNSTQHQEEILESSICNQYPLQFT